MRKENKSQSQSISVVSGAHSFLPIGDIFNQKAKLIPDSYEEEKSNKLTDRKEDSCSLIDNIPMAEPPSIIDEPMVVFCSRGEVFSLDRNVVLGACPAIYKQLEFREDIKEITISLPSWISAENVREFFIYFHDDSYSNFTISVRKLLLISDYFDNQGLVSKIINNEVIPYLNKENSLLFLEDSYLKISAGSANPCWFDLFVSSISSTAKNLNFYVENCWEKVKKINKKVLEEVVEKYSYLT